jgi:monovalent cation/hydrogen antiporter
MGSTGIHHMELIALALVLATAMLATLARRFETPYPIILVLGGLALSLLPNLPHISLSPQLVFLVLLPPLVFSGAFNTSWRDFRSNLLSISMLAFGLVAFTVVGVAYLADWLLPGFDWRLGCALGAVVSTTDTIAAISIAKRVGLPRRISDLIEGESLINDASGLLALQFAVAMVVSGERPTFTRAFAELIALVVGGIVVGLVAGWVIHFVQRRIEDPPVEITVILAAPYVAYLGAEAVHSSGVLATVVCGLYLGRKRSEMLSTFARLDALAVWNTLDFVLNGVLFIMIGLQLPYILDGIHSMSRGEMFYVAALFGVIVIGLRLAWVFPGAYLSYLARRVIGRTVKPPHPKEVFLVGWTGMRGVLALAAAISLPETIDSGRPFPQRNLILFLTFSVILITLVIQGFSLPTIIHKLKISANPCDDAELVRARRAMFQAAILCLESMDGHPKSGDDWIVEDLAHHYRQRLSLVDDDEPGDAKDAWRIDYRRYRTVARYLRSVERAALIELWTKNEINDEVLRDLERELDLEDVRSISLGH